MTDLVLPIVAANRVDIVKSAHAFDELVTLIPTPGHEPTYIPSIRRHVPPDFTPVLNRNDFADRSKRHAG